MGKVPKDHERVKEALGGAVKLKEAKKKFESVSSGLAAISSDEAKEDSSAQAGNGETEALNKALLDCHKAWVEALSGVFEVAFPVESVIHNGDFKDTAGYTAAVSRHRRIEELTTTLTELMVQQKLDLKKLISKSDD